MEIISQPTCFWVSALSSKYVKQANSWDLSTSPTSSWFWKSLLKIRPILKQGTCTQIYSGTTTYLWQDAWIPIIQGFRSHPLSITTPQDVTSTINDLFDQTSTGWNLDLRQLTFDVRAKNGDFSVKSAYRLISNTTDSDSVVLSLDWKAFWRLQIHSRHKLLFWKFLWNALLTVSDRSRIKIYGSRTLNTK